MQKLSFRPFPTRFKAFRPIKKVLWLTLLLTVSPLHAENYFIEIEKKHTNISNIIGDDSSVDVFNINFGKRLVEKDYISVGVETGASANYREGSNKIGIHSGYVGDFKKLYYFAPLIAFSLQPDNVFSFRVSASYGISYLDMNMHYVSDVANEPIDRRQFINVTGYHRIFNISIRMFINVSRRLGIGLGTSSGETSAKYLSGSKVFYDWGPSLTLRYRHR